MVGFQASTSRAVIAGGSLECARSLQHCVYRVGAQRKTTPQFLHLPFGGDSRTRAIDEMPLGFRLAAEQGDCFIHIVNGYFQERS